MLDRIGDGHYQYDEHDSEHNDEVEELIRVGLEVEREEIVQLRYHKTEAENPVKEQIIEVNFVSVLVSSML